MPYEIKEKNGKYHVVDTTNQRIRGSYENEDSAEDRKDELDFREGVRSRLDRMPVQEMTAEEKAAAYDKLMAEQKQPDPNIPPKKEEKEPEKKTKKSLYWGDLENEE